MLGSISIRKVHFSHSHDASLWYTFPLLSFHNSVCIVRMCKIIVCSCFRMCDRIESIDLNESTFNFLVKPRFSKDMTGCQIVWKIKHFKCDISRRIRDVDGLNPNPNSVVSYLNFLFLVFSSFLLLFCMQWFDTISIEHNLNGLKIWICRSTGCVICCCCYFCFNFNISICVNTNVLFNAKMCDFPITNFIYVTTSEWYQR